VEQQKLQQAQHQATNLLKPSQRAKPTYPLNPLINLYLVDFLAHQFTTFAFPFNSVLHGSTVARFENEKLGKHLCSINHPICSDQHD